MLVMSNYLQTESVFWKPKAVFFCIAVTLDIVGSLGLDLVDYF